MQQKNKFYIIVSLLAVFLMVSVLGLAQDNDSLIQIATTYTNEGIVILKNKEYNKAEEKFCKAIEVWNEIDEFNDNKAYTYYQLAILYRTIGNYRKCILSFSQAEKILLEKPEAYINLLGGIYSNIGYLYLNYGDYEKALDYYQKSESIFFHLKNKLDYSYSLSLLGIVQANIYLGNYQKAIDISQAYIEGGFVNELSFKRFIGSIYVDMKKYEYSIKIFEEILEEHIDSTLYLETLSLLSKAYLYNGDLEKAKECFAEILSILEDVKTPNDPWLVFYYEIYGQYLMVKAKEAENDYLKMANYNEAIAIFDKALLLNAHSNNHKIPYLEGKGEFIKPPQVKDVFYNRTIALKELGRIFEKQKDEFTAINYYDKALQSADATIRFLHDFRISFLNEESKLNLSEQQDNLYVEGFKIAADLYQKTNLNKYFEKMLEFSEARKSAILLASLNDVNAKNFGGIPDSLVQKEKELKLQLSNIKLMTFNEQNKVDPDSILIQEWAKSIFSLQNEHDEMIILFENNYPDYYDFKYKNSSISAETIIDKLDRNQALIEYFVDEPTNKLDSGTIYSLVFTSSGSQFYQQSISYDYVDDLESVYNHLTNRNVGDTNMNEFSSYVESAYRLYHTLLEPIELNMPITDLIIIPHGRQAYIPFDALLTKKTLVDGIDYRSLDYLVYDYNISYSYSSTLHFDYFKSVKKRGSEILAFAPEYGYNEFDLNKSAYRYRQNDRSVLRPLPGAKEEVIRLADFHTSQTYIGVSATENKFKEEAANFDILHLAMHTIINDSIPMYSKLVFSKNADSIEDGFLNTQEIYNMKFNARLAVLSACNTGSGVMRTGEGVMSMSRAFLYAGCPSIVMTLWEVEDKMSANLMMNFYQYLFKGYSKPEALRKAKLLHIKTADPLKAHPYYWLGYICIGDPSPIKMNNNVLIAIIVFSSMILLLIFFVRKIMKRKKI